MRDRKAVSVCPIFAFIIGSIQENLMNSGEDEGYKESKLQFEQGAT